MLVQYSHLYIYIVPKYILFWTGQKELWPIYLCPIQSKAQIPRLAVLLVTHPFPARGVHGARRTGSKEPVQIVPLQERPLQGLLRPTETPEDATPTGALVNNLFRTVQR